MIVRIDVWFTQHIARRIRKQAGKYGSDASVVAAVVNKHFRRKKGKGKAKKG